LVLDLPTLKGWQAELTLVLVAHEDGSLSTDSQPSK